jgi:hypothetical protein
MSVLGEEVWHVQNPALGALLLWRFVTGYSAARSDSAACPLPLTFLVLPVLLHEETARHVRTTRRDTGLRGFVAKFTAASNAEADLLLGLHDRARTMRAQTLDALRTAVGARLLGTDLEEASVFALSTVAPRRIAEEVRRMGRDAEKFGDWCAQLTLFEVSSALKVRF